MSTAELLSDKINALPEPLQVEVLHFIEFLLLRKEAELESKEWAHASAAQLERQYGSEDDIYDKN